MIRASLIAFATFATALAAELPPPAAQPVDFIRDVQPLFKEHCASCHGAEKQKSQYRVDVKETAMRGGESGEVAMVPGKSA